MLEADGLKVSKTFRDSADLVVYEGGCRELLEQIPPGTLQLIVTSPPYNIGKPYEKRMRLEQYLEQQREIISRCVKALDPRGSICWQVGNYVDQNAIVPLDIALYPIFQSFGLKLRNRIIWHFEHGLHCSKRFSGRHEVILWLTKSDRYTFNLDDVRVPQKYPTKKHFKGPKAGQYSCNPLGKNPGDVWIIPNVKHNHVEKTAHPCQFPVELVERLVLALTKPGDWVFDPFLGSGTTAIAALMHGRKAAGAEMVPEYVKIIHQRVQLAQHGRLRIRPMGRPIYDASKPSKSRVKPVQIGAARPTLFELDSLLLAGHAS